MNLQSESSFRKHWEEDEKTRQEIELDIEDGRKLVALAGQGAKCASIAVSVSDGKFMQSVVSVSFNSDIPDKVSIDRYLDPHSVRASDMTSVDIIL